MPPSVSVQRLPKAGRWNEGGSREELDVICNLLCRKDSVS
jgi:hypothetical protein